MSIDPRRLLIALAARPVVSGRELAAQFGVTRAAVWKQVEALRENGAPVVARTGSGYSLPSRIDLLDCEAISAGLSRQTLSRLGRIDVFWQIDSTSSELLRRTRIMPAEPAVCFAEIQTAGHGRHGRRWHSPLGGSLAFSIARPFESSMAALAGLSLAVGVGVAQALEDLGYSGLGLKWPNDLQVRGRKLAGILVELGGDALGPCHAVIGIGINLRLEPAQAAAIDQPWIDLASILGVPPPDRNHLAARLLARLDEVLDQFATHAFSSFVEAFAQYDVLRGQCVRIRGGRSEREGVAIGVDNQGALRVRTQDGEIAVDSGEVSVRVSGGSTR